MDEVDNLLHRRSREKHASHAELLQVRDIGVRNDPHNQHEHVVELQGMALLYGCTVYANVTALHCIGYKRSWRTGEPRYDDIGALTRLVRRDDVT